MKKSYYFFYLNLIEKNREDYSKTNSLNIDFIFSFPKFKEILKENLPVHYLSEFQEILNDYCSKINKYQIIIAKKRLNFTINGISRKKIWLYF